jgi:F-type H+-transporting ATPase subunit b
MTLRRAAAIFLASLCLALALGAQEAAKNPEAGKPAAAQSEQKPAPAKDAEAAQHAREPGPSRELAEASREAAGEAEPNAKFKESPSVQWFARHTGLGNKTAYWVLVGLNFVIIAGAIAAFWRSKIPAMFRARTAAIQKGIEEARQAGEEASRRLAEIEQRLAKLDAEIAAMRAAAEAEAAAEEERIRAAAEDDKRKVIAMATQEIVAAERAARRELKSYAAELAVGLAEQRVRVDGDTDRALVRSFVEQIGEAEGNGSPRKETS